MNDLVVKNVNLFGDTIMAAKDKEGQVWAGVKWLCEGLGLTDDQMRNERKKISKDVVLSKGGSNLTLPTKGGKQEVLCLRHDFVPLWIAKITVTPSMKENNPELVDKLVQYQLKAKDVLAEAFLPKEDYQRRLSPEEMIHRWMRTSGHPRCTGWSFRGCGMITRIISGSIPIRTRPP